MQGADLVMLNYLKNSKSPESKIELFHSVAEASSAFLRQVKSFLYKFTN